MLCYANTSALYAENDPFLPLLNKIDFILSFYCTLSCLWKAVIWQCLMVRVCLCASEERWWWCFASKFLSCVKGIAFFGTEFNEMINDPQNSHSQQGEKRNEGAEDSIGLLQLYVSCGPSFENVNCFWNMKSSFLIAEGWITFDVAEGDRNRSRILIQVSLLIRLEIGQWEVWETD